MTKWRHFAAREFPRVVLELGLPAATSSHDHNRCPRHGTELDPDYTRICLDCHNEAWAEVGRRYRTAGKPAREEKTMQHETQATAELVPLEGDVVDVTETERPPGPPTLFGSDPEVALTRIVKVADELARTIRAQKLAVTIGGKEHVLVEGWTLLGTLLGVYPVLIWTRRLEDGWEARVEARTLTGEVVGAAESECLRSERRWAKADDYAIRSMAATRSTSKALRQPLGFVMSLAGFEATPVEELPPDGYPERTESPGPIPDEVKPTDEQAAQIRALLVELRAAKPEVDWKARAEDLAGVPGRLLTKTGAALLIERLQAELAECARNDAA